MKKKLKFEQKFPKLKREEKRRFFIFRKKRKEEEIENIKSIIKNKKIKNLSSTLNLKKAKIQKRFLKKAKKGAEEILEKSKDYWNKSEEEKIDRPNASEVKKAAEVFKKIRAEVAKIVIGQEGVIEGLIRAVLCDGHVLLEGVPGIAKTLAIRALAAASGCESKRIQFTVDLLPSDIVGITTYTPNKGFEIIKGPIFANFIIGDEVNRSPPKTQSALLESMQERQVTIGKSTFPLPKPFFVMATENPLEVSGVYSLPEAQIDRFLFKLIMSYPGKEAEIKIMEQNVNTRRFDDFKIKKISSPKEIIAMQELVHEIYMSDEIKEYIVRIVLATRDKSATKYSKYIEWGASPRASIGFFIAAKAQALMSGRNFVLPQDIKDVAKPVLRHRVILNYEAQADNISADKVIESILNKIKTP